MPWDDREEQAMNQPRFANPEGCHWSNVFGDWNKWHVVDVKVAGKSQEAIEEDLTEAKHEVLQHVTSVRGRA